MDRPRLIEGESRKAERQEVCRKPSNPGRQSPLSGPPRSLSSLWVMRKPVVTGTKSLEKLASDVHPCYSKCSGELVEMWKLRPQPSYTKSEAVFSGDSHPHAPRDSYVY